MILPAFLSWRIKRRTITTNFKLLALDRTPSHSDIYKIFGYGILLMLNLGLQPALAQSFDPLPPAETKPVQPNLLPSPDSPLDKIPSPPEPESVLDVPGTISVQQFEFVGNTVFERAELEQAIASFTNKPISFAQLVQAANQITQLYVSQGYITTGAYIPEQSLDSNTVQIQIVEGSLESIQIDVTGRIKPEYVEKRLSSRISTPLNIDRLQSALQLLQLDPIIESLNAELSAGTKPGTNILRVDVNSADTLSLRTQLNNNRNLSIGTFERGLQLESASLLGTGDRLSLAYSNTEGSNRYSGGYSLPINSRDGTLGINFRWGKNQIVQSGFEELDIDIRFRNYDLTWRQPILQKASPEVSQELALSISAGRRESDSSIMNVEQTLSSGTDNGGELRTSVISLGQEWLQRNRRQVISARSQFNLGVDLFDATILDGEADSQFFSWRGQFSYLRSLNKSPTQFGTTLIVRSQLQLATDALVSTEQFSLGGANTVRGYRQDALLTDSGFLATTELRLPIAKFEQIDATLQLTPFVDFGTGWNTDDTELEFETLIGAGFGLLLQTPERFSARIDWGIPLLNSSDGDRSLQEDGVYLQLEYDFF